VLADDNGAALVEEEAADDAAGADDDELLLLVPHGNSTPGTSPPSMAATVKQTKAIQKEVTSKANA